jgi:hypothetical protein
MSLHLTFQDDLKAYADGELPLLRRLAVRRHLTHCASCREEISHMTQIADDLRATETQEALDPALRAKLLAVSISEEPDSISPRHFAHARPAVKSKRLLLALGLAGAFILACMVFFPTFQKTRGIEGVGSASVMENEERAPSALSAPSAAKSAQIMSRLRSSPSPAAAGIPDAANPDLSLRQVHKEASLGVQVANPETASDTVEMRVKEAGGFVATNTLNTGGDGLKSAEMTVKVPVGQFETILAQVAKLGSVQSKNVTGEDITDKSSDADQTESVLESDVQTSESRLKALGPKAKWSDQQATRDLRTQLAQARARLVLLKRMAALSTITIDLSQTPKPAAPTPVTNGFLDGLKGNTHDALQSLLSSASALLALVIWLLAYAPIWIPLLLVGRYGLREYRKRQELGT